MGYPESDSQPHSNVEWDFPAKKAEMLIMTKGVSKLYFLGF